MRFSTRRGFTIREILLIIVIISVGLLSVVVVLTNGMKYVQKTRQKVIALNLAREGMEAIYQIRDTNRTRWAGVKDQCWLKSDPLTDEGAARCNDDNRFSSGAYVLQRLASGGQEYFALTGSFPPFDLNDGVDSADYIYTLCQQSGYRDSCMGQLPFASEGRYFRIIEGLGLYLKDVDILGGSGILCTGSSGPDTNCGNGRAKEFRFCSKVVYVGDGTGEVKLCGVLTNFKGK